MREESQRLADTGCTIRRAVADDVRGLVELLRDDTLGMARESADAAAYDRAFRDIDSDPRSFLAVVEDPEGRLVGTMQVTLLPGLSRGGATRLQIEAVRVASGHRSRGLGEQMLRWAEAFGAEAGAALVQLTTDRSRDAALRFYVRHGYTPSHEGLKKPLDISRS